MNIFNLFRKHAELRKEFDALYQAFSDYQTGEIKYRDSIGHTLHDIEKAIAELQVTNAADLQEFRERLNIQGRRRHAGRSFKELAALAERGELERAKQNAQ